MSRVQQHTNAIDAAIQAGAEHVLYTSLTRAGEPGNPLALVPEHRETERLLAQAGVPFTLLRNNIYPDMLSPLREAVETGVLPGPAGARAAYVTRTDCAAVAAAILAEGSHEGQFLEVTGPEAVGIEGIAEALTEATGRPVRFEPQAGPETTTVYETRGVQGEMAEAAARFWRCASEGWLDITTNAVQRVAGRPPTTLAAFFATQREALTR